MLTGIRPQPVFFQRANSITISLHYDENFFLLQLLNRQAHIKGDIIAFTGLTFKKLVPFPDYVLEYFLEQPFWELYSF